ncbi:MAG: ATP-binding cassette domain-containing protein [Candidatus Lokiarchaeota archaeon]|nr:ATP-binding cassette domain-containing protein [Candidatus Lokiarchaeota archaeon]
MTVYNDKIKNSSVENIVNSGKKRKIILSTTNLKTYYPIFGGLFKRTIGHVKAVDGVTFNLYEGETLGLVGESGCGKTTIAKVILNLVPTTSGEIFFKGQNIIIGSAEKKKRSDKRKQKNKLVSIMFIPIISVANAFFGFAKLSLRKIFRTINNNSVKLLPPTRKILTTTASIVKQNYHNLIEVKHPYNKALRKKIQMVFQDPDSSLNPRWKIVNVIGEPLKILLGMTKRKKIRRRVLELLETVSMKREHLDRYPHEFSGGQKQRIVIARALSCNPEMIILDEPTSALDVSVQAQILNLLKELQKKFGLSYLFITHDLSVVQHIADRIAVMYLGKFVETGTLEEVFYNPTHPYTRALLSARPTFDPGSKQNRIILEGDVPSPINPPSGCAFHPRCPNKDDHIGCGVDEPRKMHLGGDHYIYCLPLAKEKRYYKGVEKISDTWTT